MKRFLNLRNLLAGPAGRRHDPGLFTRQSLSFLRAQMCIRMVYAFALYLVAEGLPYWHGVIEAGERDDFQPLWPVGWIPLLEEGVGELIVLLLQFGGVLWVNALPGMRSARVTAFLGMFLALALRNSFGKIGHSGHLLVLLLFVLIFLPVGWASFEKARHNRLLRQQTLNILWSGMALLMLTYTMSGFGKIVGGLIQAYQGQVNVFAPDAMALHIAERLLQTNSTSWLGTLMIDQIYLSWPLMIGAVYLQFFALWAMFRPTLQPFFAVMLSLFHIGSYFTLTIIFPQNVLLLMILFMAGPFVPEARKCILFAPGDLPVLGWLLRSVISLRKPRKAVSLS